MQTLHIKKEGENVTEVGLRCFCYGIKTSAVTYIKKQ